MAFANIQDEEVEGVVIVVEGGLDVVGGINQEFQIYSSSSHCFTYGRTAVCDGGG